MCFALSVAARAVVGVYKPLLEPMGLTHPQYLVMLALWQYEPVSVRDLSEMLQLDPGTLSPLLKRMEASGLLRRGRDARDERALAITLTPAGRALRSEGEKVPPAVVARLGMDAGELRAVHESLSQVIAVAHAARTDPERTDPSASSAAAQARRSTSTSDRVGRVVSPVADVPPPGIDRDPPVVAERSPRGCRRRISAGTVVRGPCGPETCARPSP